MATVAEPTFVEQVGETAGLVWHALHKMGPLSLAQLPKKVDAPRDLVMLAVGWLAREGKVTIEERGRKKTVLLS